MLLLLTGPPASGKTTIVNRLVEAFEALDIHPIVVSDSFNSEYNRTDEFYLDKRKSSDHTSILRSEIMRLITSDSKNLVILDSLNYAKSQRYELSTIAKNNRKTFCNLFCDADEETTTWLNGQRDDGYAADVFEDLRSRFERPKPHLKGDKPTIELQIGKDDQSKMPQNVELPFDEICNVLMKGKPVAPNQSTTPYKFC
ncbi:Protein KTI12-like protein [Aphelenchoides bicaudatus]|nr:Protein KTI12-like protein [Aphelenchoides bicaudatus]